MATVETKANIQRFSLRASANSLSILGETFLGEKARLPKTKARLLREIQSSLPQIVLNPSDSGYQAVAERFCDFLPRTYASVAAFCMLSGKRYGDISPEALDASRLFWQIGHKQDDIIDDPNRQNDGNTIIHDIFADEGVGHRKTLALLYKKIESSSELSPEDKHYLRIKIKSWFDFIGEQESGIRNAQEEDFSLDFCKDYRESQNMMAGSVVSALLNWSDCTSEKGQRVERILPKFSYMSQIIDDVGDIPEDLEANRPSFAVGALNEHPDEKALVTDTIMRSSLKKLSYDNLKRFAPESVQILDQLFEEYYQVASELGGKETQMVLGIAKIAYVYYAKFREVIYRLNPAWATF
jgi:hypothetical protein